MIAEGTRVFCRRFEADSSALAGETMIEMAGRCRAALLPATGEEPAALIRRWDEARALIADLIAAYEDFLRQRGLTPWPVDNQLFRVAREYSHSHNDWVDWQEVFESRSGECLANFMLTICHQTRFLIGKQIENLERDPNGTGFARDRMHAVRELAHGARFERGIYLYLAMAETDGGLHERIEALNRDIARISGNLRRRRGWADGR